MNLKSIGSSSVNKNIKNYDIFKRNKVIDHSNRTGNDVHLLTSITSGISKDKDKNKIPLKYKNDYKKINILKKEDIEIFIIIKFMQLK